MARAGDKVRALRTNLQRSLDGLVRELAWNIAEHGRELVLENYVSKGTTLSSWNISVGAVDTTFASTKFEPYSWLESNELRQNYDAHRRQTLETATLASFGTHVYVSNATPYLFEDVNLNKEYGGENEQSMGGEFLASALFQFAASETKRLVAAINFEKPSIWGGRG